MKKQNTIIFVASAAALVATMGALLVLDWLAERAGDADIYKNSNTTVDSMKNHTFSAQSEARLATADERLQRVARAVLEEMDVAVLCGFRGEAEQNAAYAAGNSKLRYPQSKHNQVPSQAIDLAPYPIDWSNIDRFVAMGEIAKRRAAQMGISIAYGGDWVRFKDYPHIELA